MELKNRPVKIDFQYIYDLGVPEVYRGCRGGINYYEILNSTYTFEHTYAKSINALHSLLDCWAVADYCRVVSNIQIFVIITNHIIEIFTIYIIENYVPEFR